MNDPYGVLGISSNASDEEVKRAYRELARKYHPDNYQNNPLADLAEEKMKEINQAYDTIMKMRSGGSRAGSAGASSGGYSGGYSGNSGGGSAIYAQVRAAINRGNLQQAETLLNQAPSGTAEWHFLMGSIAYRKGWLDEARQQYQMACNMEPGNMEYRQAFAFMQSGGQAYRPAGYGADNGMMGAADCCASMMCLNCLCGGRGC
jgi:molecular chaperone DnaJ